jgi:hypothetical protein
MGRVNTYIVRVAPIEGDLVGIVEQPGGEGRPFHDSGELVAIINGWEQDAGETQAGKASGSTSSSPILET